jgi:hypothetical protein
MREMLTDEERRERRAESKRQWKMRNPEHDRQYRLSHTAQIRERKHRWYLKHRERVEEKARIWHLAHPGAHAESVRKWQKSHPKKLYEIAQAWRGRNRVKLRAHSIKQRALESGLLVCPTGCQNCGSSVVRLDAHHPDYSKPIEVTWLCRKCHTDLRGTAC